MSGEHEISELPCRSKYIGNLPKGCVLCDEGAKMVLLVTGLCTFSCFYCPLSEKKKGKDVIYANELFVGDGAAIDDNFAMADAAVINEAKSINAKGAGITGGDPMIVPERTIRFIRLLKEYFGVGFHIHLYTGPPFDAGWIDRLADAGLDEIRFHPPVGLWNRMDSTEYDLLIRRAIKSGMDTGVEIPAIPGKEKEIAALANYLENVGERFLNLNELEFSETNWKALKERGYDFKDELSSAVKGSEETAMHVLEVLADTNLNVHYCSSSYKDAVQLRKRIMRRAKNVARSYERISDDGTLIKGVIEFGEMAPQDAIKKIQRLNISKRLWAYVPEKRRIEIEEKTLRKIARILKKSGLQCFITEEYPTADALEVEREPL